MEQQGDVTNGGDGAEGANGGPAQPSKEKKTRRPRWSEPEQRTMLLAAIERRLILRGRFLGGSGANYKRRKAWEEVARAINAIAPNRRTWEEAKSKIEYLRTDAKKKYTYIKMKYGRTGAPSIPDSEKLSDIYELVLQYYGDVAVDSAPGACAVPVDDPGDEAMARQMAAEEADSLAKDGPDPEEKEKKKKEKEGTATKRQEGDMSSHKSSVTDEEGSQDNTAFDTGVNSKNSSPTPQQPVQQQECSPEPVSLWPSASTSDVLRYQVPMEDSEIMFLLEPPSLNSTMKRPSSSSPQEAKRPKALETPSMQTAIKELLTALTKHNERLTQHEKVVQESMLQLTDGIQPMTIGAIEIDTQGDEAALQEAREAASHAEAEAKKEHSLRKEAEAQTMKANTELTRSERQREEAEEEARNARAEVAIEQRKREVVEEESRKMKAEVSKELKFREQAEEEANITDVNRMVQEKAHAEVIKLEQELAREQQYRVEAEQKIKAGIAREKAQRAEAEEKARQIEAEIAREKAQRAEAEEKARQIEAEIAREKAQRAEAEEKARQIEAEIAREKAQRAEAEEKARQIEAEIAREKAQRAEAEEKARQIEAEIAIEKRQQSEEEKTDCREVEALGAVKQVGTAKIANVECENVANPKEKEVELRRSTRQGQSKRKTLGSRRR